MGATSAAALPAWCSRLIAEFEAADRRASQLALRLSAAQLNWQPAPGVWSVGQCLEHLCAASEAYLPAIRESLRGKPVASVPEIQLGWFSRWFLRSYIAPGTGTKRAQAPRKIAPGARVEPVILDRFLRNNQEACEVVRQAGSSDVNQIRFKNPFVPWIRFTVGTGLEILSQHEARHLLQAERVIRNSDFPG